MSKRLCTVALIVCLLSFGLGTAYSCSFNSAFSALDYILIGPNILTAKNIRLMRKLAEEDQTFKESHKVFFGENDKLLLFRPNYFNDTVRLTMFQPREFGFEIKKSYLELEGLPTDEHSLLAIAEGGQTTEVVSSSYANFIFDRAMFNPVTSRYEKEVLIQKIKNND